MLVKRQEDKPSHCQFASLLLIFLKVKCMWTTRATELKYCHLYTSHHHDGILSNPRILSLGCLPNTRELLENILA